MAHAQGLLTHPSLNFAQIWALQYWLHMERRTRLDDKKDELELQVYHLAYDRWAQLYDSPGVPGDLGQAFGGEPEIPVTDPSDLDQWYESLGQPRTMSGASAPSGNHLLGYAEGPGRRV